MNLINYHLEPNGEHMRMPTQDEVLASGRHVITFASGGVTMFAALHLITGGDANSAASALNQIGHGFSEIVAGSGTLIALVSGTFAALSANPILQLIKGAKAVSADPAKIDQLKALTVADQAPLVTVTDKLPDVAAVATTRTEAGKALAEAVPSMTVQSVAAQTNARAI